MAQTGQGESEGVLGHRLCVGPFGARPDPFVVQETGLGHPLHTGKRELHPPGCGDLAQPRREAGHVRRVEPHQTVRTVGQIDDYAAS